MFVTKRKVRKVILAAINAHKSLTIFDGNEAAKRDAFMYQCGELNMAMHILKELNISGRRLKGETNGESNSKRNTK